MNEGAQGPFIFKPQAARTPPRSQPCAGSLAEFLAVTRWRHRKSCISKNAFFAFPGQLVESGNGLPPFLCPRLFQMQ
jgi:hypothetical protein